MSNDAKNPFGPAEAFTRMWLDFTTKMATAGKAMPPELTPPEMLREMRNTFLRMWGETFNQYMRSSEFLGLMQQSLAGALQVRQQLAENLGNFHHELQGVSRQDIDQVISLVRGLDQRLRESGRELDSRMAELAGRMERLERSMERVRSGLRDSNGAKQGGKHRETHES